MNIHPRPTRQRGDIMKFTLGEGIVFYAHFKDKQNALF